MDQIVEVRKKLEIARNAVDGISEYLGELNDLKKSLETSTDELRVKVNNSENKLQEIEEGYGKIDQIVSSLQSLQYMVIGLCSRLNFPIEIWPNSTCHDIDIIGIQKVIEHMGEVIEKDRIDPISKFGEVRILDI